TPREREPRLCRGEDAAHLRQGALGHVGPLGEVPREHVPDPARRRPGLRAEADELPGAHAALREHATELSRAPAPLCRGCAAPPERARRRPARAHPRAPCHAGRCAHLLHAGADTGRARRLHRLPPLPLRAFRLVPRAEFSTRPDDKLGSDEEWDFSEGELQAALERNEIEYFVGAGEGSFYGPK